jgi:hypothetical protein
MKIFSKIWYVFCWLMTLYFGAAAYIVTHTRSHINYTAGQIIGEVIGTTLVTIIPFLVLWFIPKWLYKFVIWYKQRS